MFISDPTTVVSNESQECWRICDCSWLAWRNNGCHVSCQRRLQTVPVGSPTASARVGVVAVKGQRPACLVSASCHNRRSSSPSRQGRDRSRHNFSYVGAETALILLWSFRIHFGPVSPRLLARAGCTVQQGPENRYANDSQRERDMIRKSGSGSMVAAACREPREDVVASRDC